MTRPYELGPAERMQVAATLDLVAESSRACRLCGRRVWFVRRPSEALVALTDDCAEHIRDCPGAPPATRARV